MVVNVIDIAFFSLFVGEKDLQYKNGILREEIREYPKYVVDQFGQLQEVHIDVSSFLAAAIQEVAYQFRDIPGH